MEQVPTKASYIIPDGDFPYNYTVAGNYKQEGNRQ